MGANFDQPSQAKERERIQEIRNNSDEYNWMIQLDGKIIGNASLNSIQETSSKLASKAANYTILIGNKNFWRKGIAQYVAAAMLEWAFFKADFQAIVARALKENIASLNLLKKLGFQYLGSELDEGGDMEWRNFKITKENFHSLKAE